MFKRKARDFTELLRPREGAKAESAAAPRWSLQEYTAAAVRDGRHDRIEDWRTLCGVCRQWVGGIYHVNPIDGTEFCEACAKSRGIK